MTSGFLSVILVLPLTFSPCDQHLGMINSRYRRSLLYTYLSVLIQVLFIQAMTQLWVPSSSPLFLYSPSSLVSETLQGEWTGSLAPDQPQEAVNQSLWSATESAAILFPSIYCMYFWCHRLTNRHQFHARLQRAIWLDGDVGCQFSSTSIMGSWPGMDRGKAGPKHFPTSIRM